MSEVVRLEDEKEQLHASHAAALERLSVADSTGSKEHADAERLRAAMTDLEARLTAETRKLNETKASHEHAKTAFVKRSTETIAGLEKERGELLVRIEHVEKEAKEREQKLRDEVGSEAYRAKRMEVELGVLREERDGWQRALDGLRAELEVKRRKKVEAGSHQAVRYKSPLHVDVLS